MRSSKVKRGGWRKPEAPVLSTTLRVRADLVSRADQLAVYAGLPRAAILRQALEAGMDVVAKQLEQRGAL